jgi:predicted  nucleic acid-binding Zn-ribbon protein
MEVELRDEIKRLTGLQAIDQELRFQEQELSKITARVDELQTRVEQSSAELERLKDEEREAALARRELERTLAEGEVLIRNKRMRLSLIKNDRELQALGHEVEVLKESNQRLEAELLTRMDGGDQRGARLQELSETLARDQAELKEAQTEIASQIEELRARTTARRQEREQLAAQIKGTLCQRYEVIFGRRGGLAVVPVKSGTCQGCRMRIPPQLFNQIQRYEAVHYCPNCQRILYYEPDKETEA